MIELYSEKEGLSDFINKASSEIEYSASQLTYLKELDIPSDIWGTMSSSLKKNILEKIDERLAELGINNENEIINIISQTFSPEIQDSYHINLETAPSDIEQIEQISDILSNTEYLKIENWEKLDISRRLEFINNLECKIAEIEHRPSCPIYSKDMGAITIEQNQVCGLLGGFNPTTKDITINSNMLGSNNPHVLREILDTIIHEGRHAYQDYNVNVCEIHPRHAEVVSWSETMEGGKWGYCGSSSTLLGQRLYEQQSIEIDARNFASDILDKLDEKKYI